MKKAVRQTIMEGADGGIRIRRNAAGVPIITAATYRDALRGLGYVHARDRQLQSVLGREMLRGRLSERLRGVPALVESDMRMRGLDILPDPEEEIADLEPAVLRGFKAYAAGFNSRFSRRPIFELRLFNPRPEPWRVEDSLLLGKSFGFIGGPTFQVTVEKLLVQMVQQDIDDAKIREIYTYLREPIDRDLLKKVSLFDPPVSADAVWVGASHRILPRFSASNNWAVSGRRTASGKPLLCGDIHQDLTRIPNIWQEIVVELPDNTLAGATIPGVPGMILGRTRYIAWSPTTSMMDVVDLRIEEVRNRRYRRADGWKEFRVRKERFGVRGKEPVEKLFYETDRGILEGDPAENGYYLVQDWSIRRRAVASDFNGIFRLNAARTAGQAMEQLKRINSASFNWVVADIEGNIGYQMSGRIYRKPAGVSGLMALPAWERRWDPAGFLDKNELPALYNPPEGFFATANNDLNHLGGRPVINIPDCPTRARRIADLLREVESLDVEDMRRMQHDLFSPKARRYMRILGPLLSEEGTGRAARNAGILKSWDCTYDLDSRGAMLFESVRRELVYGVFGENGFGRDVLRHMENRSFLLSALAPRFDEILLSEQSAWFGGRGREEIYRAAVRRGLAVRAAPLRRKRRLAFRHLLFGGILPSFLGFDYGPRALPGGRDCLFVNKIFGDAQGKIANGPVYRLIADMSGGELYTSMPGGPSDRRFSRWYASGMRRWFRGEYSLLR